MIFMTIMIFFVLNETFKEKHQLLLLLHCFILLYAYSLLLNDAKILWYLFFTIEIQAIYVPTLIFFWSLCRDAFYYNRHFLSVWSLIGCGSVTGVRYWLFLKKLYIHCTIDCTMNLHYNSSEHVLWGLFLYTTYDRN